MKKIITIILCLTCIVSLAACNSGTTNSSSNSSASATPAPTEAPTPTAEPTSEPEPSTESEPAAEGGKTLVVYYSASGNTERVANVIAATTGGDIRPSRTAQNKILPVMSAIRKYIS